MKEYLNQSVEWQRVVQRTGYGEPIVEKSQIKVRYEERLKRVVSSTGADAVSTAVLYSVDDVKAGDLIRIGKVSREILVVKSGSFLDGTTVIKEAYL